jgi:transketolase
MRTAFIEQLCALAEQDERIWLVCADLGYSVLEVFSSRFPGRYLNAGIAEQNMTGIAAGLALAGKTVFTYSIANFPVMRCLEQVRNDVCYHNLNVKIVSVGGGLAYGSQGYTHHGVEDLAVMSVLPNMTVVAPGDPVEARAATAALARTPGPAYLRLGKAGEPVLHQREIDFELGLASTGRSVRLLSMPTLVPLDVESIRRAALETKGIITIEEHGRGGLGTMTAEVLAGMRPRGFRFTPMRLGSAPVRVAGSQSELRGAQGLSVGGVVATAEAMLGGRTQ